MTNSITRHFENLPDLRCAQGKRHHLDAMIVIAICAVICAADSWADVVDFGQAQEKWFKTFLSLPYGIPSQDTFERVFARLDPEAFEACFAAGTAFDYCGPVPARGRRRFEQRGTALLHHQPSSPGG